MNPANIEAIDRRIHSIMEKSKKLSTKQPVFSCGEFPPIWNKPISEKQVAKYESSHGIVLPADYRRFITTVANGGSQPFYGLHGLPEKGSKHRDVVADVSAPFPYTIHSPLNLFTLSDEGWDELYGDEEDENDNGILFDAGFLLLCTEGCGMDSILIVNSTDPETYGTVWYYDMANDCGIFPLTNPKNGKVMSFLDWLEYYVDKTLELPDDEYFGYGTLVTDLSDE